MNTTDLGPPATTGTLHLTRILVSYEHAIRLLRIRDTYDWHQKLWLAFSGRDGQPRDFLTRVDRQEESYRALLLSSSLPHRPDWCPSDRFDTKPIPEDFFSQTRYRFSLLANPTWKPVKDANGNYIADARKRKRRAVTQREDLVAWIQRKAAAGGFIINADTLRTIPRGREFFHKDAHSHGAHTAVEFQGDLAVADSAQFRATVAVGIGSAKAFGFGLLVLAPLNP